MKRKPLTIKTILFNKKYTVKLEYYKGSKLFATFSTKKDNISSHIYLNSEDDPNLDFFIRVHQAYFNYIHSNKMNKDKAYSIFKNIIKDYIATSMKNNYRTRNYTSITNMLHEHRILKWFDRAILLEFLPEMNEYIKNYTLSRKSPICAL